MDSHKQLLDELMGKNRNVPHSELKKRMEKYSDPQVCRNWLVSICYNDLFPNTPHDEGTCKKRHDTIFKYQFENDDTLNKLKDEKHYISDAIYYIERKIAEIDAKIKSKKQLIDGGSSISESDLPKELADRVEQIEHEIKRLQEQSAQMGQQGNLEESEALAEEAERLRVQKEDCIRTIENPLLSKDQKVCEICGAYQASNDTVQRIQTHLEGKIHQGFLLLRREIERLRKRYDDLKILCEQKLREQLEKESKSRSKSKKKSKKTQKEARKSRSRSRSNKKKEKKEKKHHKSKRSRSNFRHKKDQ